MSTSGGGSGGPRTQKQAAPGAAGKGVASSGNSTGTPQRKPVPAASGEASTTTSGPTGLRKAPARQQKPQGTATAASTSASTTASASATTSATVPAPVDDGVRLPRTAMRPEAAVQRQRSAGPKRGKPAEQGGARPVARKNTGKAPERLPSLNTQQPSKNTNPTPNSAAPTSAAPTSAAPTSAGVATSPDESLPSLAFSKPVQNPKQQQKPTHTQPRGRPTAPAVSRLQIPAQLPPAPSEPLPLTPVEMRAAQNGQLVSGAPRSATAQQQTFPPQSRQVSPPNPSQQRNQTSDRGLEGSQALPKALRTGNNQQQSEQTAEQVVSPQRPQRPHRDDTIVMDPRVSGETSRSRNVTSPSSRAPAQPGMVSRKPVNQGTSTTAPASVVGANPLRSSPPNPPPPSQTELPAGFSRATEPNQLRQSPPSRNMNPLGSSPPNPRESHVPIGLYIDNSAQQRTDIIAPLRIASPPRNQQQQQQQPPPPRGAAQTYNPGPPPPRPGIVSPPRMTSPQGRVYNPRSITTPPEGVYAPRSLMSSSSPPRNGNGVTSPPNGGYYNRSPPRPPLPPAAATYPRPAVQQHAHSSSVDSNTSLGSSATATSTRNLISPPPTQAFGLPPKPNRQQTDLSLNKKAALSSSPPPQNNYYSGDPESQQGPYMTMLLSLDKIPRLHNILVVFFTFLLLLGFVIIPGSFTSIKRKVEESDAGITISLPGQSGQAGAANRDRLLLSKSNTAAMVIGFVLIITGTFGSAWLALRWRRNYVWLLNKLYMPMILNAIAGIIAAVTNVYALQFGEWSTQAIIAMIIEASVLVVCGLLFLVYNYWLVMMVKVDKGERAAVGPKRSKRRGFFGRKKKKKTGEKWGKKKKGGILARFRGFRRKPPIAAGSVV
ncbi:hypothetical protein QBC35DRAFT_62027 [Podospora australis]|uniref:Uncharacterized protein n=1 Tax=Podospora australis TaxID=1536484 RepID=A0AAN6WZR1_9PEZI|nr:hypothetical protein QBC35DRAFT_62027 [Podospora australis]